jgi:4-hydroxy-tetrahydrodipicolinate reductase
MKIGIAGCKGRMGTLLVQEILSGQHKQAKLAGGTALPHEMKKGKPAYILDSAEELFKKSDVVIDFTVPAATRKHIDLAVKHKKTLILGTTGLSDSDDKKILDASKKTRIIKAANFSLGVNLLSALVERSATALNAEWDIEIFESHHKNKIDAPSGTALALGRSAQKGRKGGKFVTDREGKRKSGDIGFSVARGGDVVGEHTVFFYGEGERIELTHVATNRALFARGAIRAALWSAGKKPGLYSMKDVLGL